MKNIDKIDSLIRAKPDHEGPPATPEAPHPGATHPDPLHSPVATSSHPATPTVAHPSGLRPSTSTMSSMIRSPDVPAAPELVASPEPVDSEEAPAVPSAIQKPSTSGKAAQELRVAARQSPGKSGVR